MFKMILSILLTLIIAQISFANDYSYKGYFNKCKRGDAAMRTRAVTGEYRDLTCKEYAIYKTTGKWPSWAWTSKNPGNRGGGGGGYAPAPHKHMPSQEQLDRSLANERYKISRRVNGMVFDAAFDYLNSIPFDDVNGQMWKIQVQSNINQIVNNASDMAAKNIIKEYNQYSSDYSDHQLRTLINSNIEYLLNNN